MNKRIKPLILVVGKSGSGKDYIVDKICSDFNKSKVLSRTTRKPRFNNENTHLFVSKEQADKEFNKSIAKTIFNGHRYYTLKEDLENADLYIIDRDGVYNMQNSEIKYKSVYLKVGLIKRIKNMRKRGDRVKNIISRLVNDYVKFKGFKADIKVSNTNELYSYFQNGAL